MKNSASTMKELALTLFGIKDTSTYRMDCPFEEDPRGYVEVIGDDPFTPFSFKRDGKEIQYRNLTLFSDHISFIAGEQEVVLMPDDESIVIYTVDSAADALISEERLPNPLLLADHLISILTQNREEVSHGA